MKLLTDGMYVSLTLDFGGDADHDTDYRNF